MTGSGATLISESVALYFESDFFFLTFQIK